MYRLLRRYTLPVHNLQLPTIQINVNQNSRVCSFCSFYHSKPFKSGSCLSVYKKDVSPGCNYSAVRHQTTSTSTAILDERTPKKIKHKMRKYAELLEVSGETTTNKKAKVKKLNATSVSKFANEPEISLDQLHKIGKKSKAAGIARDITQTKSKDVPIFDAQEEMNLMTSTSSIGANRRASESEDEITLHENLMALGPDQTTLIKNASVLNTLDVHSEDIMDENALDSIDIPMTPAKKLEEQKAKTLLNKIRKSKAAVAKNEELEMQFKRESLKRNLLSYLDVCVNSGMTVQGYSTLIFYRNRGKRLKYLPEVIDIGLYNILLQGFSLFGNINKIKEIMQIITEDSIPPNPQTYAAIFECVGRMKSHQNDIVYLKTVTEEMTANGISLNDIFNKSTFVYDQREIVERGIRLVKPDFQVVYTPPNTSYTNHLLDKISNTTGKSVAPAKGLFTKSEFAERGRQQMKLEMQGHITVKSIAANAEITPLILHCREKITEAEDIWKKVIVEALERDIAVLGSQYSGSNFLQRSINIYPYLKVLDTHHYVDAISNEIKQLATGSETFSPSLNTLTKQMGTKIFHRYAIEMKKSNGVCEKISELYEKYCDRYLSGYNGMNTRTIWQNLLHEESHKGPTADMEIKLWPPSILASIGRFMYNILLRDIKIDINSIKMNNNSPRYLPAFYAVFRNNRQMITQEIKPHPTLSRIYREAQLETLTFEPAQLPSIGPPIPWYSIHNGGYLISDAKIIRLAYQATQQWQRLENVPQQQLYPILDSLNQLGSIPWKVNNPVLDIALKVFQTGGSKVLDIPEPPSHPLPMIMIDHNASKEERNKATKARLQERRKKADMYSLWCDTLYRLSLATHFKDEVFWLPHSMDFRGRVYPIPPHVNHLGSDLARSLMVFALGKPLGPDGLDWLKIHIINLTGLKKREANSERLKYANEMLPKILESAENPLDGERWWQESEEPWQTLAACFEIAKAIKSPNPAEYVSHFPVHQDGSCNGLQHYAALGRDQQGAESVNLSPSLKPQDVYSSIAALVEKERKTDAENGLSIAQMLDGLIKRKVIKQTVMTTVYGVTRFGARLQIARQLKEIEFPDEYLWHGSHYLVNKTFISLREMFTSTKLIQDWLTDSARLVTLVCGQNMEWVTPLGLAVVQPYSKVNQRYDSTKATQYSAMDVYDKPNVMKQKNAFPPNFIHSLDSSHMMLTSLHCEHEGLTFVSVHDCFWTHACTVPQMNTICREQFVALHSEPILENLSEFLNKKFSFKESELDNDGSQTDLTKRKLNKILTQVPKQGAFDLKSVLKSVYFFS